MDNTILIIERIVIESLGRKALNFERIKEQTSLNDSLLQGVLSQLIQKGILTYNKFEYELNWKNKEQWLYLVSDKEGAKAEIKELFACLVNRVYKKEKTGSLRVQKIYLNECEKEELDRKMKSIDSFIQGVRNQRKVYPVKENISKQQVIFYGNSSYSNLVDEILKVG